MKNLRQVLSERREERKQALARFVECREYGTNPQHCHPDVGRDIMQMFVWRMRVWNGKIEAGEAHNQERVKEIRRIQSMLGRPIFRSRFINAIDTLLHGYEFALQGGLIGHGNVVSYGGGQVQTEDSFDESVPAQRAYTEVKQLRADAIRFPLLWFYCFVLRCGALPPERRACSSPLRR